MCQEKAEIPELVKTAGGNKNKRPEDHHSETGLRQEKYKMAPETPSQATFGWTVAHEHTKRWRFNMKMRHAMYGWARSKHVWELHMLP